jgi:hypothetical protein
MNIAELINEVGVDNVRVQFLDQCADSLDYNHNTGTRIKFGTQETITPEGTVNLGIVVWLPRDAVKTALAKAKAAA